MAEVTEKEMEEMQRRAVHRRGKISLPDEIKNKIKLLTGETEARMDGRKRFYEDKKEKVELREDELEAASKEVESLKGKLTEESAMKEMKKVLKALKPRAFFGHKKFILVLSENKEDCVNATKSDRTVGESQSAGSTAIFDYDKLEDSRPLDDLDLIKGLDVNKDYWLIVGIGPKDGFDTLLLKSLEWTEPLEYMAEGEVKTEITKIKQEGKNILIDGKIKGVRGVEYNYMLVHFEVGEKIDFKSDTPISEEMIFNKEIKSTPGKIAEEYSMEENRIVSGRRYIILLGANVKRSAEIETEREELVWNKWKWSKPKIFLPSIKMLPEVPRRKRLMPGVPLKALPPGKPGYKVFQVIPHRVVLGKKFTITLTVGEGVSEEVKYWIETEIGEKVGEGTLFKYEQVEGGHRYYNDEVDTEKLPKGELKVMISTTLTDGKELELKAPVTIVLTLEAEAERGMAYIDKVLEEMETEDTIARAEQKLEEAREREAEVKEDIGKEEEELKDIEDIMVQMIELFAPFFKMLKKAEELKQKFTIAEAKKDLLEKAQEFRKEKTYKNLIDDVRALKNLFKDCKESMDLEKDKAIATMNMFGKHKIIDFKLTPEQLKARLRPRFGANEELLNAFVELNVALKGYLSLLKAREDSMDRIIGIWLDNIVEKLKEIVFLVGKSRKMKAEEISDEDWEKMITSFDHIRRRIAGISEEYVKIDKITDDIESPSKRLMELLNIIKKIIMPELGGK
ncbi:hypothetical protein KY339_04155 [Candidatus Woesearchaeota archaeon]|nr:hypothetical protein [Candidatus Woesearchaeota archaeon]